MPMCVHAGVGVCVFYELREAIVGVALHVVSIYGLLCLVLVCVDTSPVRVTGSVSPGVHVLFSFVISILKYLWLCVCGGWGGGVKGVLEHQSSSDHTRELLLSLP